MSPMALTKSSGAYCSPVWRDWRGLTSSAANNAASRMAKAPAMKAWRRASDDGGALGDMAELAFESWRLSGLTRPRRRAKTTTNPIIAKCREGSEGKGDVKIGAHAPDIGTT